jgi:hypothetical protein
MFDEDRYSKKTRINFRSIRRKEEQTVKRLKKEQERLARAPSCRLGKNDKKQTARTNIILDEERIQEATSTEKPHQKRVILSKQKRKQGHRDLNATRIQLSDHLPDLEEHEFDELSYWSKNIIWRSQEIDKEERNIRWAYQVAIDEMNEQKKSDKWYCYLNLLSARNMYLNRKYFNSK